MNPLDREARASRYLDAMDCLYDLIARRARQEDVPADPLCQLIGILNDEGRKVVPRHVPGERAPGLSCANDEEEGR